MNTNEKIISDIDARIKALMERRAMWGSAGGMGGKMAMDVQQKIKLLTLKRDDLINGTHEYEIYKINQEIKRLKLLKEKATLFKKIHLSKQIKAKEQEIESIRSK